MTETARRLVLRYDEGQFSFRHFAQTASDEQLYELANLLNTFQADELDKVVEVRVFRI